MNKNIFYNSKPYISIYKTVNKKTINSDIDASQTYEKHQLS